VKIGHSSPKDSKSREDTFKLTTGTICERGEGLARFYTAITFMGESQPRLLKAKEYCLYQEFTALIEGKREITKMLLRQMKSKMQSIRRKNKAKAAAAALEEKRTITKVESPTPAKAISTEKIDESIVRKFGIAKQLQTLSAGNRKRALRRLRTAKGADVAAILRKMFHKDGQGSKHAQQKKRSSQSSTSSQNSTSSKKSTGSRSSRGSTSSKKSQPTDENDDDSYAGSSGSSSEEVNKDRLRFNKELTMKGLSTPKLGPSISFDHIPQIDRRPKTSSKSKPWGSMTGFNPKKKAKKPKKKSEIME